MTYDVMLRQLQIYRVLQELVGGNKVAPGAKAEPASTDKSQVTGCVRKHRGETRVDEERERERIST